MSEAAVLHPAGASPLKAVSPKKAKGEKKQKKPSTHPPVNDMIVAALQALKERKGSSLQAVKKYIAANYTCDIEKLSPFIRKSLKSGVEKGRLVHTKGTGANGSFKLKPDVKKKTTATAKKPAATARKPKTAGTKAGPKKAKAALVKKAKKAAGAKKAKAAGALKQKPTKHSKSVAKKPKTPKPKKAMAVAGGAKKKPAHPKK